MKRQVSNSKIELTNILLRFIATLPLSLVSALGYSETGNSAVYLTSPARRAHRCFPLSSTSSSLLPLLGVYGLRLKFRTLLIGAMMLSEVFYGKKAVYSRVQA